MEPVRIGERLVGPGRPTFIVAEIGINHNGDPVLIGDSTKLRRLDWEPEISLEQILQDALEFWRALSGNRAATIDRSQAGTVGECEKEPWVI